MKHFLRELKLAFLFLGLTLLLGTALFAQCPSAQQTTVTFTLTDSASTIWANATVTANLYNPSGTQRPLCASTNQPFPQQVVTTTNGSGVGSMVITGNSAITPPGTRWIFTIQSNTSALPTVSTQILIQTGGSQSLTTTLSGQLVLPVVNAAAFGAHAYVVAEVIPNPCVSGNQWFDVETNALQVCNNGGYTPPVASCSVMSSTVIGCAKVDDVSIDLNGSNQLQLESIPSGVVPAVGNPIVTSVLGDGHVLATTTPNSSGGSKVQLGHTNLAQLDTSNTFATGTQTIDSGSPSTVAQVITGQGVATGSIIANSSPVSSSSISLPNVAVGEVEVVLVQFTGHTPTSSLGNVFTLRYTLPGNVAQIYTSPVTVPGTTDTLSNGCCYSTGFLVTSVNTTTPFDVGSMAAYSATGGTDPISASITPSLANDMIVQFDANSASPCSMTAASGFTPFALGPLNSGASLLATLNASSTSPISANWTNTCSSTGSGWVGLIALQTSSTFTQGTDLSRWTDSSNDVLSGVDKIGRQFLASHAGLPTDIPNNNPTTGNPENPLVYDSTNNAVAYYNFLHSWTHLVDKYNAATELSGIFQPVSATSTITRFCSSTTTGCVTNALCSTANTGFAQCSFTATLGVTYADTNYGCVGTAHPPTTTTGGAVPVLFVYCAPNTDNTVTITFQNADASGAGANTTPEVDVITQHP